MSRNQCLWEIQVQRFILFVLFITLSGCSGTEREDSTLIPSAPPLISTSTPKPTQMLLPTSRLLPTGIPTPKPSSSPYPTKTITLTPLATFNPTQVREVVDVFFFANSSDVLDLGPITPGVSTWEDTQRFFERFAIISDPYSCCWIGAAIPMPPNLKPSSNHYKYFDIYLYMKRGIIPSATIDFVTTRKFGIRMSQLLDHYGQPTQVYVFIMDNLPIEPYADYALLLVYEEQGFLISFEGKTGVGDKVSICPDISDIPDYGTLLILWPPGEDISFDDIIADDFLKRFLDKPYPGYFPLQDVKKMSIAQFTEFFTTAGNLCLSIDNPTKPSTP